MHFFILSFSSWTVLQYNSNVSFVRNVYKRDGIYCFSCFLYCCCYCSKNVAIQVIQMRLVFIHEYCCNKLVYISCVHLHKLRPACFNMHPYAYFTWHVPKSNELNFSVAEVVRNWLLTQCAARVQFQEVLSGSCDGQWQWCRIISATNNDAFTEHSM
jgi:hypothetical protein